MPEDKLHKTTAYGLCLKMLTKMLTASVNFLQTIFAWDNSSITFQIWATNVKKIHKMPDDLNTKFKNFLFLGFMACAWLNMERRLFAGKTGFQVRKSFQTKWEKYIFQSKKNTLLSTNADSYLPAIGIVNQTVNRAFSSFPNLFMRDTDDLSDIHESQ